MKILCVNSQPSSFPSFPRRRESRVEQEAVAFVALDSRLHGNDGKGYKGGALTNA